jgi:hypothetical protein
MNLKRVIITASVVAVGCMSIFAVYKGKEKDALEKRVFKTTMVEMKEGQPPKKGVEDEIEFKGGKLFSNVLFEKLEYKWVKYEIKKDSSFTDEDAADVQWIEGEASTTNSEDQTMVMTFKVENYDIEGTVKITKNDKLKKQFEFSGKEKPKKK